MSLLETVKASTLYGSRPPGNYHPVHVSDQTEGNVYFYDWVNKNCSGKVLIGAGILYFENEKDALLFRLSYSNLS